MTDSRQSETTTYNENFYHSHRGIAKYYLHTAYNASQPSLSPPQRTSKIAFTHPPCPHPPQIIRHTELNRSSHAKQNSEANSK